MKGFCENCRCTSDRTFCCLDCAIERYGIVMEFIEKVETEMKQAEKTVQTIRLLL